jgi:putative ABC transport system substrate-binding protein
LQVPRYLRYFIVATLTLLYSHQSSGSSINQLVIVKSSDNSYYNKTIETLIDNIDQTIAVNVLMADKLDQQPVKIEHSKLYITLGIPAAKAVSRFAGSNESISAYLTHEQYQDRDFEIKSGVLLDQSLQRYLLFSKLILQPDSIGLISLSNDELNNQQIKLLAKIKLDLDQYRVDSKDKLLPVLRKLLMQNDALLVLPQHAIYNRDSLKGVLLTSYRSHKPVISYSPAHVKAGALGSIFSSPRDIGKHLAIIINQRLKNQRQLASGFEYARFYSIATNTRVARSLGLNLPAKTELRARIDELDQ